MTARAGRMPSIDSATNDIKSAMMAYKFYFECRLVLHPAKLGLIKGLPTPHPSQTDNKHMSAGDTVV